MGPALRLAPIEPAIAEAATFLEATLDALLPQPAGPEARLMEAMRYATMGGASACAPFLCCKAGGCSAWTAAPWAGSRPPSNASMPVRDS